jgi:large subunit ribosomal protein L3
MKFILGIKRKMSQVFTEDGKVVPVTIVEAGPLVVTQVKNKEKDSYDAVQVGFGVKAEKNINKPQRKAMGDLGNFKYLKEFRLDGNDESKYQRGDKIDLSIFEVGDVIHVSGISKGKGFQGVVKRHGFAGGPRTHGQKHSERAPGSIGSTGPQRVFKGKKMAGRMGSDRVTVKNLKIVQVDKENNLLFVSGAIPGRPGTLLELRSKS